MARPRSAQDKEATGMAKLFDRLSDLAGNRDDIVLALVDDIDSWGFTLMRDGKCHLYLNAGIRDFRKSMMLVQLLGDYAYRRFQDGRNREALLPGSTVSAGERILLERARDAWIAKFSRRLLWRVRLGLHGAPSRRPKRDGREGVLDEGPAG